MWIIEFDSCCSYIFTDENLRIDSNCIIFVFCIRHSKGVRKNLNRNDINSDNFLTINCPNSWWNLQIIPTFHLHIKQMNIPFEIRIYSTLMKYCTHLRSMQLKWNEINDSNWLSHFRFFYYAFKNKFFENVCHLFIKENYKKKSRNWKSRCLLKKLNRVLFQFDIYLREYWPQSTLFNFLPSLSNIIVMT